jgi:hypothetical protein
MGFRIAMDCDLGLTLAHGGGYPGYGSYLLLLPEQGIGIFAFANRTYAGPSPPVWAAALDLHRAGLLAPRPIQVSDALARAYRAATSMYGAGNLGPGQGQLAMNFLMDRSAENWAREFTRLKEQTGSCQTNAPIMPTGALSGAFTWSCERGRLEGNLLLAPTNPPAIQALRLRAAP